MKRDARWLALILGAYLALALLYDWATPIFEATDEGTHMAVVRWMALTGTLPVQDPANPGEWLQEGSQPPLYHALGAALTQGLDWSDWENVFVRNSFLHHNPGTPQNANFFRHLPTERFPYHGTALAVHLIRWFSILLGAGTVLAAHHWLGRLFPARPAVVWLATALIAFNPKFVFVSASVNNDNLLIFLSTSALALALPLMQTHVAHYWRRVWALGIVLGLAALTKISGLILWPLAALCVGWGAWRARDWKRFMVSGLILAGVALALSGWWYWRNVQLYGEPLGLRTMVAIAGPRTHALDVFTLLREEWYGFYRSYWGVFGVFTILESLWVRWAFDALTGLALVGMGWRALRQRVWPRPEVFVLIIFVALTFMGVLNWTLQTPASQGRLVFGAIAPLSLFIALGLLAPFEARSAFGPWPLGFGIFALALIAASIPIADIAPRYAYPRRLAEADLPADLRPARVTFNDSIELIGYAVDWTPRHPGDDLRVTLYWRALQPMTTDYALALHLLGRAGEEVGKIDTWPGGGNAPTSLWQPGDIFADVYSIPLDSTLAAPTVLRLYLDFWEGQPDNRLPAAAPDGSPLASVALNEVGRVVPLNAPRFAPAVSASATFEYGIRLLGLDAGADGAFTLYWQTDQPIPGNYTVFAHLLDANGAPVTQADSQPLNGDWPTGAWLPNAPFAETRHFDLTGIPPGVYALRLGWYDANTLARLEAYQSTGARWPDDGAILENVIEIK